MDSGFDGFSHAARGAGGSAVTVVDLVSSLIVQSRMAAPVVVEPFDAADDVTFGFGFGGINSAMDMFIFQRALQKRTNRTPGTMA